jgi:hypothetical protein
MRQSCPFGSIESIHINRRSRGDSTQAQILPERGVVDIWLTFAPSTTNHSPPKSVSDKKKAMDRVNEGKDGGASEWESASSLYKACQQTLGALCDHFVASVENRHRICQIHTRLSHFGVEPLHKGILDECLKGNNDLRDYVINLLRSLGHTILRGMFIVSSPSSHSVSTSPT